MNRKLKRILKRRLVGSWMEVEWKLNGSRMEVEEKMKK